MTERSCWVRLSALWRSSICLSALARAPRSEWSISWSCSNSLRLRSRLRGTRQGKSNNDVRLARVLAISCATLLVGLDDGGRRRRVGSVEDKLIGVVGQDAPKVFPAFSRICRPRPTPARSSRTRTIDARFRGHALDSFIFNSRLGTADYGRDGLRRAESLQLITRSNLRLAHFAHRCRHAHRAPHVRGRKRTKEGNDLPFEACQLWTQQCFLYTS